MLPRARRLSISLHSSSQSESWSIIGGLIWNFYPLLTRNRTLPPATPRSNPSPRIAFCLYRPPPKRPASIILLPPRTTTTTHTTLLLPSPLSILPQGQNRLAPGKVRIDDLTCSTDTKATLTEELCLCSTHVSRALSLPFRRPPPIKIRGPTCYTHNTPHTTHHTLNHTMDIDMSRRNKRPRPLSDDERSRLEEFIDSIHYSSRYNLSRAPTAKQDAGINSRPAGSPPLSNPAHP